METNDAFLNTMEYKFDNWGWLATMYHRKNDFKMPSWKTV